jgi:hypothetical protein
MQLPILLNFSFFNLSRTYKKTRNKLRSIIGARNKGQKLSKKSLKLIKKYLKPIEIILPSKLVKYWFKFDYDKRDESLVDIEGYAINEEDMEVEFKIAVDDFIMNVEDAKIKSMLISLKNDGALTFGKEEAKSSEEKIGLKVFPLNLKKFLKWSGFK